MSAADEAWQLMDGLWLAARHRAAVVAAEFGLSPPQVLALRHLDLDGGMPMNSLAAQLRCDNSNVTGIIDRLEDRGLVERRPALHDRRVKHLALTDEGRSLRARIDRRMAEAPEVLARLSAADQRTLRDVLRRALDRQV